jgi:hypothetical protein
MTVSTYLQSGAGRGVAAALGRIFSKVHAGLLVAGMVAGAGMNASAAPSAAAVHSAVGRRDHGTYQDAGRLETALQPLKEDRELFEAFLDGYRNLVEDLNDATYAPGTITSSQQIGLFRDVILEHVARERRELREGVHQEELESAKPASLDSSSEPASMADLYRAYHEGNEYLRAVITRTTEDLAAVVEAGTAGEASLERAFGAYLDFQAQMQALSDFEDTGSPQVVPH